MFTTRLRLLTPIAAWFTAVLRGMITAPLVAPHTLIVFALPLQYSCGAVPALVSSGLVAAWVLIRPQATHPTSPWVIRFIALIGAIVGAVAWGTLLGRCWLGIQDHGTMAAAAFFSIPGALILAPYWVRHITHPKQPSLWKNLLNAVDQRLRP